jgi:hypothetical protein
LNNENVDELVNISNRKLFDMIDILVDALSSYKKVGAPRALFEIACLKMCGLKNEEERIVYKEVVREENIPVYSVKEEVKENPELIENIVKEEIAEDKVTPVVEEKVVKEECVTPPVIEMPEKIEISEEKEYVSRENCEKYQENEQKTPEINRNIATSSADAPSEEELLNVLVQASRDALVKAQQQWVMLPKYLSSPATAKVTGMLLDGRPMAACDNVVIIGYANDVYLNRVYSENNYNEMNSLLKALYNHDVKCYCLTVEKFNELKGKYISLRQLGKLPQAKPIVIQRKNITISDNSNTDVDEGVEYAKRLFGDNVIIKEEN